MSIKNQIKNSFKELNYIYHILFVSLGIRLVGTVTVHYLVNVYMDYFLQFGNKRDKVLFDATFKYNGLYPRIIKYYYKYCEENLTLDISCKNIMKTFDQILREKHMYDVKRLKTRSGRGIGYNYLKFKIK